MMALMAKATSASGPDARRRAPSKAVKISVIWKHSGTIGLLIPGQIYPVNITRVIKHRQPRDGLLRNGRRLPGTSDADRPSSQQLALAAGAVAARRTRSAL